MNQTVSVAKVAGESASVVVATFRHWSEARIRDHQEPGLTEANQWPVACRGEMRQLALDIRAHAHHPPIVFYNEHVDMWSMGDVFQLAFPKNATQLYEAESDDGLALLCYELPDGNRLREHLKGELARDGYEETKWYLRIVRQACSTWQAEAKAAIVVVRRVVGGLVTDEEVDKATQAPAEWLRRYSKAKAAEPLRGQPGG